jgi:hypothetical protein
MNKTIWIPIVGGFIFGALSFLISAANITITISKDLILGPWEIFNTISAALFGPIGLLITQFGMDSGGYLYLINGVFPAPHDVYFIICEYLAHSVSLLGVAFGYRFIYLRMKMPLFLAGWSMTLGIYYVILAILQVSLYNFAVPGLGASYVVYFRNIPVELLLIIFLTSLILLALPARYRRPLWYESKQKPDRSGKFLDE